VGAMGGMEKVEDTPLIFVLVLAGKFVQDKAYSKKAWAKLSNFNTKEITRCEHARQRTWKALWVSKTSDANIEGTHNALADALIC
jgi:hypothetical protein